MRTTLTDIRDVLQRAPSSPDGSPTRHAAVALLLTPSLDLFLLRRAEREGDPWSGHIGLPGGHVDPDDASPLHAALRETREEIGVVVGEHQLLGPLDILQTYPTLPQLHIHPFVFAIEEEPITRLNHEVRSLHRLDLNAFLADEGRGTFAYLWHGQQVDLPCVNFEGGRVWGLTLRILDDLRERLTSM